MRLHEIGLISGLRDIRKLASDLNVELSVKEFSDHIEIRSIDRFANNGEKGSGAKIIDELCKYASLRNKPIILAVKDNESTLISYYEKFGFKSTGDFYCGDLLMKREA